VSGASSIEWTDATWNPVRGCSRVSEGCRNCYAERQAARFSDEGVEMNDVDGHMHGAMPFAGFAKSTPAGPRWTGEVALIKSALDWPLRKRKPLRIFVNSMSDLFHEKLSNAAIAAVFGAMAACPQHTFQILTKRPERMAHWFKTLSYMPLDHTDFEVRQCIGAFDMLTAPDARKHVNYPTWPLPNVWLGTSVENQATADERIPNLLATPAAKRFVSAEPLLGPVDLSRWLAGEQAHDRRGAGLSGVRSNRSFLGGFGGSDLEAPAANCRESGRDAALLEGTGDEARRAVDIGRLPDRHVLGRQEATQGLRTSSGLDVLVEGRYSSGDAGQPQERDPNGHDSGEFGDGHKRRECSARDPRPREEGEAPLRGGESGGEADRRSGAKHSSARRKMSQSKIAEMHGVKQGTVSAVILRKSWAHIA
jgi:protein gp37